MGSNFLIGIKEKDFIGKLEEAAIYSIKDVEFFEMGSFNVRARDCIEGLKKLLAGGFFFSYHTDLTSSRQRLSQFREGGASFINDSWDKRYMWNNSLC